MYVCMNVLYVCIYADYTLSLCMYVCMCVYAIGPRGADKGASKKKVPDKNDSNRYKGFRGFLRKLFE
jgi:hypothetical protein